jgi:homoserine dehydrogenase
MPNRRVRLVLVGLGNVGRNLMELFISKKDVLGAKYGVEPVVVGAVDSSGAALNETKGLDVETMVKLKTARQGVSLYPNDGRPGMTALDLVRRCQADILVEMSPSNMPTGQPGLMCIREALNRRWNIVTANKSPLVLAYGELMALATRSGRQLRFSACVGGGLPSVNVGQRDLVACTVNRVEGILNSTTHYILTAMADEGKTFDQALAEAQRIGIAEADPTLDIDGWDAAYKCIIVANSVLGMPATLRDVTVTGIRGVTVEQMNQAKAQGNSVKLLVSAERDGKRYRLSVRPTVIPPTHPLASLHGEDMGIVYYTDIMAEISVIIRERGPVPTAAGVLRDIVAIAGGQ